MDTPQDLEARLDAQRRILRWLLPRVIDSADLCEDLLSSLDQSAIPQDHQEDPGAVPTEAFGSVAAFNAEMRVILGPLKSKFNITTD